jgi:hypothetical protein
MIDSLSRAGLVPATPSSAPASPVRGSTTAGPDADVPAAAGDDSGDAGVTTSFGAADAAAPTYGPTGRFDVAVITTDDAGPDADGVAADDGAGAEDAGASAGADVGGAGRGATSVREYLAVWGAGSSSGGADGADAASAGAGALSALA